MSKYNQEHERNKRDFYPTPAKAVVPLKNHLIPSSKDDITIFDMIKFVEPCCGDGRLIRHLEPEFNCIYASDLEPQANAMARTEPNQTPINFHTRDLLQSDWQVFADAMDFDYFITNPPWLNDKKSGFLLNSIIEKLSKVKPTWLLMNGSYAFNKKSAECMMYCTHIVPVGRVKWIEGSPHMGKEDCAWFCFDQNKELGTSFFGTVFHPRKV